MRDKSNQSRLHGFALALFQVSVIIIFVLLVNLPVIDFGMVYPEQSLMYIANQRIQSASDFMNVYLHPQMFHYTIAFFRPSGHFLIYQILTPLLGWMNIKGFIISNLIFLGLTGYLMIKVYERLFPKLSAGGYIAFSLYLMHPALILPRLMTLHFEFAHTFFLMLGLYFFIRFTQDYFHQRIERNGLLGLALASFVLATTFKEPALMLGGVYFLYFGMSDFSVRLVTNRQHRNILMLVLVTTVTLAVYLTLPWPQLSSPVRQTFKLDSFYSCIQSFFYYVFNLGSLSAKQELFNRASIFTAVSFPWLTTLILWVSAAIAVIVPCSLLRLNDLLSRAYRKSISFILLSSLLFLVLPFGWGMGNPWHYSLSILMLSLIAGFSYDYLVSCFRRNHATSFAFCGLFSLIVGFSCFATDLAGIRAMTESPTNNLILTALRNAVNNPPDIKQALNRNSVIIIEDNLIRSPYMVDGAGTLPYYLQQFKDDFKYLAKTDPLLLLKNDPNYSGTLFRYAYAMPSLREQAYPFSVEQMNRVPDQIIYQWLKQPDNIFCLAHDVNGNWFDKTRLFRENLMIEKKRRHLTIGSYQPEISMAYSGSSYHRIKLPYADQQLCEYVCDQDKVCGGFNYRDFWSRSQHVIQCNFYFTGQVNQVRFDATTTAFMKRSNELPV